MSESGSEAPAPVEVIENATDLPSAVRLVLKGAMKKDGVIRGIHEVVKVIESGNAQLVFLAENCDQAAYKKLVSALCQEKNVPCVEVPERAQLGEWAGLCKLDKDGQPRKVVQASCVVVTEVEEGQPLTFLKTLLK